jgi:hypothetical protein
MLGCLRYTELSSNTRKESMRTWRRRKETLGVLGEHAKRHKSVYISVNNNMNLNFLKILSNYTIWDKKPSHATVPAQRQCIDSAMWGKKFTGAVIACGTTIEHQPVTSRL